MLRPRAQHHADEAFRLPDALVYGSLERCVPLLQSTVRDRVHARPAEVASRYVVLAMLAHECARGALPWALPHLASVQVTRDAAKRSHTLPSRVRIGPRRRRGGRPHSVTYNNVPVEDHGVLRTATCNGKANVLTQATKAL